MKAKLHTEHITGKNLAGVYAVVKCENCQCEVEVCLAETTPKIATFLSHLWNNYLEYDKVKRKKK